MEAITSYMLSRLDRIGDHLHRQDQRIDELIRGQKEILARLTAQQTASPGIGPLVKMLMTASTKHVISIVMIYQITQGRDVGALFELLKML